MMSVYWVRVQLVLWCLLAWGTWLCQGSIVIDVNRGTRNNTWQESLALPTSGYFRAKPYRMQHSGVLFGWRLTSNCSFQPLSATQADLVRRQRVTQQANNTAVIVSWIYALRSGCDGYAQVADAAAVLNTKLAKGTLPPISLLLIILPETLTGGPHDSPYVPYGQMSNPSVPAMDTYFLSLQSGQRYQELEKSANNGFMRFAATYDSGEWNDALYSDSYLAFCWIIAGGLVAAALYTLVRVFLVYRRRPGTLQLDFAMCIYMLSIASTGLVVAALVDMTISKTTWILGSVASFLAFLVLLLVLWLWSQRLHCVYPSKWTIVLRLQVVAAMLVLIVSLVFSILNIQRAPATNSDEERERTRSLPVGAQYALPAAQFLLTLTFAILAARFAYGWYRFHMVRRKFMELLLVSLAGMIAMLCVGLSNVLLARTPDRGPSVAVYCFVTAANSITLIIRVLIGLFVLGVDIPKQQSGSCGDVEAVRFGGADYTGQHYSARSFDPLDHAKSPDNAFAPHSNAASRSHVRTSSIDTLVPYGSPALSDRVMHYGDSHSPTKPSQYEQASRLTGGMGWMCCITRKAERPDMRMRHDNEVGVSSCNMTARNLGDLNTEATRPVTFESQSLRMSDLDSSFSSAYTDFTGVPHTTLDSIDEVAEFDTDADISTAESIGRGRPAYGSSSYPVLQNSVSHANVSSSGDSMAFYAQSFAALPAINEQQMALSQSADTSATSEELFQAHPHHYL